MDRIGTIERLSGFFAESPASAADVAVAWLYGSIARGDARADSDVDVAVLFRHTPAPTFDALPLRLEGEIERLIRRTTQVVAMNSAPVDLRARVLRDGMLLVDLDPSLRIRFEMRTRNEWFDIQPILREYRRMGKRPSG